MSDTKNVLPEATINATPDGNRAAQGEAAKNDVHGSAGVNEEPDTTGAEGEHDEHVEERLRELFAAIVAAIHQRLGRKGSPEVVERIAQQVFEEMRRPKSLTWEAAESMTVAQVQRRASIGRVVRIAGHVSEIRAPQAVAFPDGEGDMYEVDATCAKITDIRGASLWSLDIIGADLIDRIRDGIGTTTEFLAVVVAVPAEIDARRPDRTVGIARRDFLLHVLDVRVATSAFDLLGATADERLQAREVLDELLKSGVSPLAHLKTMAAAGVGIVGLDKLPLLDAAVEFVVLQAVSNGVIGNAPAKLHMLLVGPPARGKKLPGIVARALNPICVELSSAKTSPAGLVGASTQTASGWISQPGALPQASGGVAWVQDAHFWGLASVKKIGPVLMEVIEDGCVRDSVAGGATRIARTGLLIDMNREAQSLQGATGAEAGLLRLIPLLSRIDVIMEIPRDDTLAWDIACQILAEGHSGSASRSWERDAKLLVAALRDHVPTVALSEVRPTMAETLRKLGALLQAERVRDSGDFAARLANSFERLVIASARVEGRSLATKDDLRRAMRFLAQKIDFLRKHHVRLSACPIDQWLRRFSGTEVNATDLADAYNAEFATQVSQRTMRRHVQAAGAREIKKGLYEMPMNERTNGQSDTAEGGRTSIQ